MKGFQEFLGHKATGSMATFRPGVGEHDVKRADGTFWEESLHRVGNLEPQHPYICQPLAFDSSTGRSDSTGQPLDAEEISPRIFLCNRGQEGPVTTAEVDFERRAAAKGQLKIQGIETIGRDEFHSACYLNCRIGGHVR